MKAELFPTGIRALGVALPYALGNALFGGTAEYVALWFKNGGTESGYYWYVAGCAAVSLVVYLAMKETRDIDLNRVGAETGPPSAEGKPRLPGLRARENGRPARILRHLVARGPLCGRLPPCPRSP